MDQSSDDGTHTKKFRDLIAADSVPIRRLSAVTRAKPRIAKTSSQGWCRW
ncbi:MAG TPA: hypothetical protein VKB88_39985 [Bryobacteraceae bacterium]|nr:hypothetical protein [Bryobacteraceae bacterium]